MVELGDAYATALLGWFVVFASVPLCVVSLARAFPKRDTVWTTVVSFTRVCLN